MRCTLLMLTLLVGAFGCSSGSSHGKAASVSATTLTTVAPTANAATIDWASLRNPLLSDPAYAIKDPALVFANGKWHALVSRVGAAGQWRIGLATSSDLRHWSPMTAMPHDTAVDGEASPDVVRAPNGTFVVTYQSFVHDRAGGLAKLYYRTTNDFVQFSEPRPLALDVHPKATDRVIDAALAWTPAGLLLGYKYGADAQYFEIARSPSGSLDGPWELLGRPDIRVFGDTIENYQFIELRGRWVLLATSNIADKPFLFTLTGDPRVPQNWLHWSSGDELHIAQEPWNTGSGATGGTYEHANCSYIVDRTSVDGYYYLVYSDSPNRTVSLFGGEGHAVLAIARSTDLAHWSVPPH